MHRTIIQTTIVATALAFVAPALAASPTGPTSSALGSKTTPATPGAAFSTEATPAAAQTEGLCGLTPSDVVDIVDHYGLEPNWSVYADALQVPFDCSAYGDLCSVVDPAAAQTYVCDVWQGLQAHAALEDIEEASVDWLGQFAPSCEPSPAKCAEICAPDHDYVRCGGVLLNGKCHAIALCDFHVKVFAFEDLIREILAE